MKVLIALSVLVALAAAAPSGEMELFTAFDFDAVINNDEQREMLFDCMRQTKPCGDFQKLRDIGYIISKNKCAECNPEQKAKYEHIIRVMRDKYKTVYNEIMKKIEAEK